MRVDGWPYATGRQRLGWRHQVARGGGRARRERSRWWRRCDQVARGLRDCGFATCARPATRDEDATVVCARRRTSGAGWWWRNQVAGGLGLVHASCHVVDRRYAERRDQKLSRWAGLSHTRTKAHPRSHAHSPLCVRALLAHAHGLGAAADDSTVQSDVPGSELARRADESPAGSQRACVVDCEE